MMRGCTTLVVAVCGLCMAATRGAAQTAKLPAAYVTVKAGLAPVGGLNADSEGAKLGEDNNRVPIMIEANDDQSSGLQVSFNAEVGYLFSLHPFFALGPAVGMHTWHSKAAEAANEGGSIGLDLSLVPQARLPLSDGFELYLSLPLGITLSLLNEYKLWVEPNNMDTGVAKDVDPSFGWSFGAYAGARIALDGSFGILAEIGYQRFAFTHGVEFQVLKSVDTKGSGTTLDLSMLTQQLRVNVGVFF